MERDLAVRIVEYDAKCLLVMIPAINSCAERADVVVLLLKKVVELCKVQWEVAKRVEKKKICKAYREGICLE